jgi:hypothetical protein
MFALRTTFGPVALCARGGINLGVDRSADKFNDSMKFNELLPQYVAEYRKWIQTQTGQKLG